MRAVANPGPRVTARLGGVACLLALAAAHPALAQSTETPTEGGAVILDEITVTGTKTATDVFRAESGSSVVTRSDPAILSPSNISDILDVIPSVTTQTGADDPGTAVNVRGMQDFGRVNVMVDGARQNFQRSAHGANGTFYFDQEMFKSVDVTRGPVSSVYGSGAIGGVVSITTIDASDVLAGDEWMAGRLRTAFETNGMAVLLHGETAGRVGDVFDMAAAGTWRDQGDFTDGGGDKVPHTAQDLLSGLFKARIRPSEFQELTLATTLYNNQYDSGIGTVRETDAQANTYTLGYRWTPASNPWTDLSAKTYYTTTDIDQTDLNGAHEGANRDFHIGTLGLDVFNTSRFETGFAGHELTYGVDFFRDLVKTHDSISTNDDLTPSGERMAYGGFVQDRVVLTDWLSLIGALRFDGYRLDGGDIVNEGQRLSPKITLAVTPFDPVTLYATYAEGYRAPAVTETLIEGLHPGAVSGEFRPNPNLKPEVAHNFEVGANFRFDGVVVPQDRLRLKLGAYHNRVDNFIEQVFEPFPIPGYYQYQNVTTVEIEGIEAEGYYDTGRIFAIVAGQLMRGKNLDPAPGEPDGLVSVPPNRLVTTLGFRAFDGALEAGARLSLLGKKKDAAAFGYIGDSYGLLDLYGTYQVNDAVSAGVYLNNLFDEDYTQYLNGRPSAGFNAKFTLSIRLGAS